jgi:hypothetical protein
MATLTAVGLLRESTELPGQWLSVCVLLLVPVTRMCEVTEASAASLGAGQPASGYHSLSARVDDFLSCRFPLQIDECVVLCGRCGLCLCIPVVPLLSLELNVHTHEDLHTCVRAFMIRISFDIYATTPCTRNHLTPAVQQTGHTDLQHTSVYHDKAKAYIQASTESEALRFLLVKSEATKSLASTC